MEAYTESLLSPSSGLIVTVVANVCTVGIHLELILPQLGLDISRAFVKLVCSMKTKESFESALMLRKEHSSFD